MANCSLFSFFCFVILTFAAQVHLSSGAALRISREPPIEVRVCPPAASISPCTCEYDTLKESRVVIRCSYYPVNQTSVETTMRELRRANDIPEDRGIDISWFIISNTEMTQLDFTPFYGSRFGHLNLVANNFLQKLVNSGDPADYGSIHAIRSSVFQSNILTREGYGDLLKYFSNELTDLSVAHVAIEENEPGMEFLPGLSAHTNLTELDISFNFLTRLNAGAFKGLQRLERLDASSQRDGGLSYIGENALDFTPEGGDADAGQPKLLIYMAFNSLTESSFHPNSGIAKVGRKTEFRVVYNKIRTIPVEFFLDFLETDPENVVDLMENPLFCDARLSWLKARREDFEPQLYSMYCENDPFTSPFDSDLVP